MVVCAVKLCRNYTGKNIKPSEDISFHRFPTDPEQSQQWIVAIHRGMDWTPGTHSRVCSIHFDNDDFKISETGRRILHKDAVPTKNLYNEDRQTTVFSRNKMKRKSRPKRRHVSSLSEAPLLACRACLVTDVKLYDIRKHQLDGALADFTHTLVSNADGFPQHLCSTCFTLIEVLIEFKTRCQQARDILTEAKERDIEITSEFIRTSIDRESCNLDSTQFAIKKLPRSSSEPIIKQEDEFVNFNNDIIENDMNDISYKINDVNDEVNDMNDISYKINDVNDEVNDINDDTNDDRNDVDDDGFDIFDEMKLSNLKSDKIKVENDTEVQFAEPLVLHGTVVQKHDIFVDVDKNKIDKIKKEKHKRLHKSDSRRTKIKLESKLKKVKTEKLTKLDENVDIRRSKPRKTDEDYENFAKDYSVDIVFLTQEEQINEILSRKDCDNYKNAKFKCEYCYKGFSTEGAFDNHRTKHDESAGSYECEACRFRFLKRYKLLHHQTQHKNNFVCKICGHISKLASKAMEHYKWHNGVKYPCQFCDKVFCKRTSQFNHMRMRHGSASCHICQEIFSGDRGLLTHMQKAHKEAVKSRCEVCAVQFHNPEAFSRHICGDHVKACAECGDNYPNAEALHEHMRDVHWTQIKCEKCDAQFENEKLYRMHRVVHKEIRQRRPRGAATPQGGATSPGGAGGKARKVKQKIQKRMCEMCGLTWRSTAALKYHQRVHTGEKPHQCTVCPKSFRIQDSLQIHMNTHTGARPFKCPLCPKAFKSRTQNHKHQLVHTKVRRYRCDLCDKTFQTSTCVKTHIRSVHMKIPTPPRGRNRNHRTQTQSDLSISQNQDIQTIPMDTNTRPSDIHIIYQHMGMKIDG